MPPTVLPLASLLTTLALLWTAPAAHGAEPQKEGWQVWHSPHFVVHFPPGLTRTARRVITAAERVYPRLQQDFEVPPGPPIPIILTPEALFNGEAEPLKERITLDPGLTVSSVVGTERFVAHELAHVLTFRALSTGAPLSRLNALTGLPTWFLEGLAQFEAEAWTPALDRMLRLASLEGRLLSTSERQHFRVLGMHAGAAGYNEGFSLCRHLFVNPEGSQRRQLMRLLKEGRGSFEQALQRCFGKSWPALESQWRQTLTTHYQQQVVGRDGTVPGAVTLVESQEGAFNVQAVPSPDGRRLAYMTSAPQRRCLYLRGQVLGLLSLMVADRDGKHPLPLPEAEGLVSQFAWAPDGDRLATVQLSRDGGSSPSFDIFLYDLPHGARTRLTRGERVEAIGWHPTHDELLYVANTDGRNTLHAIHRRTLKRRLLQAAPGDTQWREIQVSPDGKRLAMVSFQPGESGRLALLQLSRGQVQFVRGRRDDARTPRWLPDGRQLIYSSERSGFSDLYLRDVASGKDRALTHSYAGVEAPAISADAKMVYFTTFAARGSHLARVPLATLRDRLPGTRAAASGRPRTSPAGQLEDEAEEASWGSPLADIRPYRATLTHDLMVPRVSNDERGYQVGLTNYYSDILRRHEVGVDVGYGLQSGRFGYSASYQNRMGATPWELRLQDVPQLAIAPELGGSGRPVLEHLYLQRDTGVSLRFQQRLGGGRSLQWGGQLGTLGSLTRPTAGSPLPEAPLHTLSATWQEENVPGNPVEGLLPRRGHRLALNGSLSDPSFGSGYRFQRWLFQGERYFGLPGGPRQNLVWQWNLGLQSGEAPQPFLLGGANTAGPLAALRGHSVGIQSGQRLAVSSLAWNAQLANHLDVSLGAFYLDRLSLSVFSELGSAWREEARPLGLGSSGLELRGEGVVMGRQPFSLRLGGAYRWGQADWPAFYLTF
ncbi:MAG: hypothetical protein VKP62_15000 [Candidatus Sericytochromatia bacterium]|nr:hypothetical protein [Candidatus Sericytochromatia bacterium]